VRLLPVLLVATALDAPGSARPPAPPPAAPWCDGKPPELLNKDAAPHAFTLTCARKITERSIAPAEKQVLEGFSGCVLTMGTFIETLHTEMACTIQPEGKLVCDLL